MSKIEDFKYRILYWYCSDTSACPGRGTKSAISACTGSYS